LRHSELTTALPTQQVFESDGEDRNSIETGTHEVLAHNNKQYRSKIVKWLGDEFAPACVYGIAAATQCYGVLKPRDAKLHCFS